MDVDNLLTQAKKTWQKREPMQLEEIAVALGVVYGDICRQARNAQEGKPVDDIELKKELGNVIYSAIRWCDDLGYDPKECIMFAQQAQTQYASKLEADIDV